jgi:site-specific DNA recombinase
MGNITIIPARRKIGNTVKQAEKPKLRVAAYCRVSTDTDEQETSYETQVSHYTEYINNHPDWQLAGIFADDGISGTNTKKREQFNRMIDECMAGNIDMVITKSISRFARNTLDCLKYIRQLKEKNIAVWFEKENINTMDAKGEVLITIMASLAQQESQSLSQNVKLGIQYRYQQGKVQVNHNRFLGYTKDENGNLVIDPEQAEVVRRIYREYLEGYSMKSIALHLEQDGILTGAGNTKWYDSTINKILRNEKYMGDALLQKTVTTDFLTKKRVKNNGVLPQYYVEDDHEAIIPKDLFMQVQEELVRRRNVHRSPSGKKRAYSGNNCFSQIVVCGECGDLYRRVHWYIHGKTSIVWRCISRLDPSSASTVCTNRTIKEEWLKDITVRAFNQILTGKDEFLHQLQENMVKAIRESDPSTAESIQARLDELQTELIRKANSKEDYDAIADEIFRLREEKERADFTARSQEDLQNRITELQDFLKSQQTDIAEFDERMVRKLIRQITIYQDKAVIEFKSGVSVEIEK